MSKALLGLVATSAAVMVVFLGMGMYSEAGSPAGLGNGRLAPCPNKPNCVSSESSPGDDHAIAAIAITPTMGDDPMGKVKEVVELLGGKVSLLQEQYMASTFTSALFGFVDDVEFKLDRERGVLQVRSASRVGYSDLGANRKRVEQIRQLLTAKE